MRALSVDPILLSHYVATATFVWCDRVRAGITRAQEDCKELGFSIGERNRVAEWAGTRCKETCTHAPTRPEMLRSISRSVHIWARGLW